MTTPTLDDLVSRIRALLGDAPADEVSCEITKHGTIKLVVKRGGEKAVGTVWDAIPFEIVEKSAIRKRRGLFSGLRALALVVLGAAIAGVVTSPPASPAPPPHPPAGAQ